MRGLYRSAALLAATTAVPLILTAGGAGADTIGKPAWSPPLALAGGGAEPSIRVAPDGRSAAYVSAPTGLGSNFWAITEKSSGKGIVTLIPSKPMQPDLGTGGGDSEISVGNAADPKTGCAPIAYSGLHNIDLLDNFTVARSTDCGKTFGLTNVYGTQNTLTDRQWQTFDGRLTNHLIYHEVHTGQIVDSISFDGGQTYVSAGASGLNGLVDPAHMYTVQQVKIGNIVTSYSEPAGNATYPVSNEPIHALYATFTGTRDPADFATYQTVDSIPGANYDHMDTVYVAKSLDGGLTWTDVAVYTTGSTERRELDLIFPVIAVDKVGHLYVAWTDGWHIQYVTSSDRGAHWSKAYTVNPNDKPGPAHLKGTSNLFPWIAAGGKGNLDVVWYHGSGGDTSGYRYVGTTASSPTGVTTWKVAFAQLTEANSVNAAGAPTPRVLTYTQSATPPMHEGNVCNNGTTCGLTDKGDRTLLDFFQVAIDAQGRANIAYASDYNHHGSARVIYTRQNQGYSLWTGQRITPLSYLIPSDD